MEITPTLNFGGQCRAAIEAYATAFGGEITCLLTYRDANDPAYMPLLKEDQLDYIYHAELRFGERRIIMSDHVDIAFTTCYSNFLTIMYDTKEGSKTIYLMEATPYSACRVAFVDRFGIRWGIMTEQTER